MTTDRTQHVLDAIDGALDDWTVSEDAMRWSPEPAAEPVDAGTIWTLPDGYRPRYRYDDPVLINVHSTVTADGEWVLTGELPEHVYVGRDETVRRCDGISWQPLGTLISDPGISLG